MDFFTDNLDSELNQG